MQPEYEFGRIVVPMRLEEYQAKKILQSHSLPVPQNGGVISKISELRFALMRAGSAPWVLKAQAQTGGRGKAGGIKIAKNAKQAKSIVSEMLGMKLVTAQTGPEGILIKRVLVEKSIKILRELYFSIVLDRKSALPIVIASSVGGVEIESLAKSSPEKIMRMAIHPLLGLESYQARELLFKLGLFHSDAKKNQARLAFFQNCAKTFFSIDASLLEINPLALTQKEELICLDAKIAIDDSALFRQPELSEFAKDGEASPAERVARKAGISYIPLQGNIGCMVNGAGLAMATMDLIKLHGGEPANFLDVGGGANVEQVTTAFKIILSDKRVKAILVNIFGGIMKCDLIAEGIIRAVRESQLSVPLVVRLQGNRLEEGKKLLQESGLNIISEPDLAKAAQKAVELSKSSSAL